MAGKRQQRSNARIESIAPHANRDTPTDSDTLGFKPYVDAVADFLRDADTKPPLTLSVEGEWGSGKTSFMRQLEARLKSFGEPVVRFSAWRHDREESLWAAFALTFLEELSSPMPFFRRCLCAWELFRIRANLHRKVPAILASAVLFSAGITVVATVLYLWLAGVLSTAQLLDDMQSGKWWSAPWLLDLTGYAGVIIVAWWLGTMVYKVIGNPFRLDLRKDLRDLNYGERIAFIERFHKDFATIAKVYSRDRTIYAFIDDLDRCEAPRAADLMQAVNLLVSEDAPVVFVLGLDREKVAASLAAKHSALLPYLCGNAASDDKQGSGVDRAACLRFGVDFIEKFIQIPFQIPVPNVESLDGFVRALQAAEPAEKPPAAKESTFIERLKALWSRKKTAPSPSGTPGDIAQTGPSAEPDRRRPSLELTLGKDSDAVLRIVKAVSSALRMNPRRIVQFLNVFRLRAYIAHRTGLFDLLGALTFEQLGIFVAIELRWPALAADLVRNPYLLKRLQSYADDDTPVTVAPDESEIVRRWITHEPELVSFLRFPCADSEFRFFNVDAAKLRSVLPAVRGAPSRYRASDSLSRSAPLDLLADAIGQPPPQLSPRPDEKRHAPRLSPREGSGLCVRLRADDGAQHGPYDIINVSATGMALRGNIPLAVGAKGTAEVLTRPPGNTEDIPVSSGRYWVVRTWPTGVAMTFEATDSLWRDFFSPKTPPFVAQETPGPVPQEPEPSVSEPPPAEGSDIFLQTDDETISYRTEAPPVSKKVRKDQRSEAPSVLRKVPMPRRPETPPKPKSPSQKPPYEKRQDLDEGMPY